MISESSSSALASRLAQYVYSPSAKSPSKVIRIKDEPKDFKPTITLTSGPSKISSTPLRRSTRSKSSQSKNLKNAADISYEYNEEDGEDGEDGEYTAKESSTPTKKRKSSNSTQVKSPKRPRPFAGPEVYAHLKPVTDHITEGMDIIFCGINPGRMSATKGHHFAHPTNKFWRALHQSGLTNRLYTAMEDYLLPEKFNYGLTNLCGRPTAEQSELSPTEMRLNVLPFTLKLQKHRPRIVCFVGKKIWDIYESVASKTASLPDLSVEVKEEETPVLAETEVKVENGDVYETAAKLEFEAKEQPLDVKPDLSKPLILPIPKRTPKAKIPFNWKVPRSIRLPLPVLDGEKQEYCYFWVVPNTSGLERTPLAEQVVLFTHLKAFSDSMKDGSLMGGPYRDINISGLEQTSLAISKAAGSRSPKR